MSASAKLVKRARSFKLVKKSNGSVSIKTYGRHLKLKITWAATGSGDYLPYSVTRTYRT